MKVCYLYIFCFLFACLACDRQEIDIPSTAQEGTILSVGIKARSGEPGLPDGEYGLFGISHNYGSVFTWNHPLAPPPFYLTNAKSKIVNDKLVFDGGITPRYPIADSLSLFLYHPYHASTIPAHILVLKKLDKDIFGDTLYYKYPDYIGGVKNGISVVGGTPEDPGEVVLTMKHLMSRIRFQTLQPGMDEIIINSVILKGIAWDGHLNPHINSSKAFYTPEAGGTAKAICLIEDFIVPGNTNMSGLASPRPMQIKSMYNYSKDEADYLGGYDDSYKYYMLVPPLGELLLQNAKLEINYTRYGTSYTTAIEMMQIKINEWESNKSYCYTIAFDAVKIDYVDVFAEPWLEDIYIGSIEP